MSKSWSIKQKWCVPESQGKCWDHRLREDPLPWQQEPSRPHWVQPWSSFLWSVPAIMKATLEDDIIGGLDVLSSGTKWWPGTPHGADLVSLPSLPPVRIFSVHTGVVWSMPFPPPSKKTPISLYPPPVSRPGGLYEVVLASSCR